MAMAHEQQCRERIQRVGYEDYGEGSLAVESFGTGGMPTPGSRMIGEDNRAAE